jgi:hypothetical protein
MVCYRVIKMYTDYEPNLLKRVTTVYDTKLFTVTNISYYSKTQVFRDVMLCRLIHNSDVLKARIACIIRVKQTLHPEDERN